tara:strand:+ start:2767 stop:3057 length:291 start_codon:yes stop_codon:yes gene_type:complete
MTIEILTGSHFTNEKHNKEQFSKINDLLLNKKNPLYKKFNQELFFLDDCDELISIVKSSGTVKDLSSLQFDKLKSYLKKFVKMEGFLFVGSLCEEF